MRFARASGRSAEARIVAITASSMSMRPEQSLDDVGTGQRLAEAELRPPRDDLDLVRRHRPSIAWARLSSRGHAVDEREHVHAEARLQRRVLVEVVQHDVGVGVALQGDDEPGRSSGRVVLRRCRSR